MAVRARRISVLSMGGALPKPKPREAPAIIQRSIVKPQLGSKTPYAKRPTALARVANASARGSDPRHVKASGPLHTAHALERNAAGPSRP